jgi:hypothetical protein
MLYKIVKKKYLGCVVVLKKSVFLQLQKET